MLQSGLAGASPEPAIGAGRQRAAKRVQHRGSRLAGLALLLACAAILRSGETPALFWVLKPTHRCRVGVEGVEVFVQFPERAPIDLASFRVLLNGADVTEDLLQGSNGATGQLFGVLDGVNTLHIEARSTAEGELAGRLESRDLECVVRGPVDWNRG